MFKEHKKIKKIFSMALFDLKKMYRGAALGWFWLIAKPSVTVFVYWFAFEIGLRVGTTVNDHPYFLWLIAGMLPWLFISEMISKAPNIFKKYNYLVTKISYPVSTVPTFVSISAIIVNIMLTIIVIIIYFLIMKSIDIYFLQLPFYILMMFLCVTPLIGILSFLSSMSKDAGNLITTLPMPLLFLSPIFYDISNISIGWVKNIQLFNPINYCVNGFRNVFINKQWFFERPLELIIFLCMTLIFILLFAWMYKKLKKEMPDYL